MEKPAINLRYIMDAAGEYFECISVNYNPIDELCRLYGADMKTENGIANLAVNDKNIFSDKICLSVAQQFKRTCQQETFFITHCNKQINKQVIDHSRGTPSIAHCIAICVNNFRCQSVTYKNDLCTLHDVSVAADPEALVSATPNTYVVENGCATSIPPEGEPRPETEWSEWSSCQFSVDGERVKVRSRDCGKTECTDLQVQNCL
ncbi:unnamed protein product [Gongylonema pulchrum]|uniref:Apple domain-containing protein n=1 Tax=Gongylonema pulchrum TaxID=637853 RepID=A0A183D4T0_9BILA|nr:unnamed protein product [Gongylonema pulchrum]